MSLTVEQVVTGMTGVLGGTVVYQKIVVLLVYNTFVTSEERTLPIMDKITYLRYLEVPLHTSGSLGQH